MNLNKLINENQLRLFLHGQALESARSRYGAIRWARNWWYPIQNLPLTDPKVQEAIAKNLKTDVDVEQWVPLSEVLKVWPYSRQRFFQSVNEGHVDRQEITAGKTPFWVYDKSSIKMYLGDYAVEGRLKRAVGDIEAFIEALEKW